MHAAGQSVGAARSHGLLAAADALTTAVATPTTPTTSTVPVAALAALTATANLTPTATVSPTASLTPTVTVNPTASLTPTATATVPPTATVTPTATGCATPYLHTSESRIVNACGTPVRLQAVNWYGFDSNDFVVAGLHYWSYKTIVDRVKALGFNALRIPFSNEMVERNPVVSALGSICHQDNCVPVPGTTNTPLTGSYLLAANDDAVQSNSDLVGLDALHVLKKIVDYAGQRGLYVILDDHRSEAAWGPEGNGLWYTGTTCPATAAPYTCYTPQSWLTDWQTVGSVFATDPYVTGMDLPNEPHWVNPTVPGGSARWKPSSCAEYIQYAHWGPCDGQNNPTTDWPQVATQAGDELLGINTSWLIFVEGGSTYPQDSSGTSFSQDGWGENLQGVASDPIALSVPNRLIYSPHDYANYDMDDTVSHMYSAWTRNFGFVPASDIAPLWIGEFGTCSNRNTCIMDSTPGPPYASGDKYGWWFNTFRFYEDNQCLTDTTDNSQVCPAGSAPSYLGGPLSWAYWPVNGTYSDSWSYEQAGWRTCYGQREGWGIAGSDWSTPSAQLLVQSLFAGPPRDPGAMRASSPPPSAPWPSSTCAPYSNVPTPTPTATATTTPIPTATNTATPRPTPCLPLRLAVRLQHRSVVTGGTLTVGIRTAARARNKVMVQVLTRKTIVTGAGRHRRRVTRSVVAYRTALHGTADRHGRFTARLRIAYPLASLAPARLTVTALKGCRSAAYTLGLTILPRSQPSVIRSVTPRYLASGHTLLVGRRSSWPAKGRLRRHVVRTVVLYQATAKGTADAHGHFTGRLRIAYRSRTP
jgi:aryl-phospho-beta-D-glucosidase BglC (GH1 family)